MPSQGILIDIVLNDIRKVVKEKLGKEIEDVRVMLVDYLPRSILAYVRANQYTIYVNYQEYIRAKNMGYDYEYLFVVMLHEYLHLLGIADEREVRRIDLEIIQDKFKENSIAYNLALSLADPRDIYLKESQKFGKPNTYI
ncbi:hypothetical protein DFR86_04595 [Acidianus sulfidivorans JP7]|uniref:Metallopeptidase n=1 Tax=Acidianus sulfidivorans JP7 TaxID=619593 RepID=A0A2U9ILK5_9CREN|nr:hypothetical protein [Acidianus sulfidivorans]AWR96906.1 hypothetical protein DFR86_04595 [Acidianus sulfidivorans JP7]